jgi:drug/metabolite transporter (DMT)-like permease
MLILPYNLVSVRRMAAKVDYLKLIPYAIIYAVCSVAGLMLIKTAGSTGVVLAGIKLNWKTLLGLAIYFGGFLLYLYLVQKYPLSYVFPLVIGLNYVAVVLVAALILREGIHVWQWLGIGAVFVGILLMNIKPGGN